MADIHLLGLFNNVDAAADAIERLHKLDVSDERITVMSGSPIKTEELGLPTPHSRVGLASLGGAVLGALLAAFLTAGIFLLYPLIQGGQPLIPIPPSLIVFFEVMMLGTIWAAFFSLLVLSGLPAFKSLPYDPLITEGYIGVQVIVTEEQANDVEGIFKDAGSATVDRQTPAPAIDRNFRRFWATVLGLVTVAGVVSLLFFYDVLKIDFPTNMNEQFSYGYEQGPRLAAPDSSVPVQGPALIAGEPASLPVPSSPDSVQRGRTLFGYNCAMCHGITGVGNGAVGAFFTPKPFDLTGSVVQNLQDDELFIVISQGVGVMPPFAENLSPEERWDVINYVRTLKK
jgi:mono/diheme cytochrome c family protein